MFNFCPHPLNKYNNKNRIVLEASPFQVLTPTSHRRREWWDSTQFRLATRKITIIAQTHIKIVLLHMLRTAEIGLKFGLSVFICKIEKY